MPKDSLGRSAPKASLSCEACRRRKVRCVRPETDGEAAGSSGEGETIGPVTPASSRNRNLAPCIPCSTLEEECVTVYDRRRRGPLGSLNREGQTAILAIPLSGKRGESSGPPGSAGWGSGEGSPGPSTPMHLRGAKGVSHPPSSRQPDFPDPSNTWNTTVSHGGPVIMEPADSFSTPAGPHLWSPQHHRDTLAWRDHSPPRGINHLNSLQYPKESPHQGVGVPPAEPHSLNELHPISHSQRYSIEDTLSRDTAVYMISLYFDYVHALIPCIHRPTFLERMRRYDDQVDPRFFALVMSLLAATIVHVPKALLPFQNEAPIELASRCLRVSRAVSTGLYDPPSPMIITVRYFDSVFFSLTGQPGAWAAALSEVRGLAIQLNLHRESSYIGLNPVETEMRRRIFQTAFTADKSAACMQDQLIMLRAEDCDAQRPREIDDEYITEACYYDQPDGTVSKMAGHRIIAQTFKIIGEILTIRRSLSRSSQPSQPALVLAQLRSLNSLDQQLLDIYNNLPEPLRLESSIGPSPPNANSASSNPWECQALSDLNTYLSSLVSNVDTHPTSEAFLVMQGNCHVTRAIARLIMISCRDEILANSGPQGSASRTAAERVLSHSYRITDRKDLVISDLLYALRRIPIQALSVNSRSIVNKIRFVAVTLLDSVVTPVDVSDEERSAATKNQDALISFLNILSEIEQGLIDDYSSVQQPTS